MTSKSLLTTASLQAPDLQGFVVRPRNDNIVSETHLDASDGIGVSDHGNSATNGRVWGLDVQIPDFNGGINATRD